MSKTKSKIENKAKGTTTAKRKRNRPNRNTQTKVYKTTTDKVGDVLVNQAGVKYKIVGQRYHAPNGYDDGKLKVRILKIEPEKRTGLKPYEISDREVKYARDRKIWVRQKKKASTKTTAHRERKKK